MAWYANKHQEPRPLCWISVKPTPPGLSLRQDSLKPGFLGAYSDGFKLSSPQNLNLCKSRNPSGLDKHQCEIGSQK